MENYKKIVASHQPHFFPWLGYFDKMAKADLFLINDVAQLEVQSPMLRNRIVDNHGVVRYINVVVDKKGYLSKENREINLKNWNETRESIKGKIRDCYIKSCFFPEIWPLVEDVLDKKDYVSLVDLDIATIELGRECLGISTPLLRQSLMIYKEANDPSTRLAEKLVSIGADIYLSGIGGKNYMKIEDFESRGIEVIFQSFSYPAYPQIFSGEFVSNLSFLDIVFNCGLENSRSIFWKNVHESNEKYDK